MIREFRTGGFRTISPKEVNSINEKLALRGREFAGAEIPEKYCEPWCYTYDLLLLAPIDIPFTELELLLLDHQPFVGDLIP